MNPGDQLDPITSLWLDHFPLADPPERTGPMFAKVKTALTAVVNLVYGLKASTSSLSGYLNPIELVQVVLPAILHGGGVLAILTAVAGSASTIFAAPYAATAVALLTAAVQVYRLFSQGTSVAAIAAMKRPPGYR